MTNTSNVTDASQTPQYNPEIWVDFEHVGDHFTPGCIILTKLHGEQVAARFNKGTYLGEGCRKSYSIHYSYMHWDGTFFGPVQKLASVPYFPDTQPFSQLECYPIACHPYRASIEQQLRERGRRWEELHERGRCHQAYHGDALYPRGNEPPTLECLYPGRIILDAAHWQTANPSDAVYIEEALHEGNAAKWQLCDDCVLKARQAGKSAMPPLCDDCVLLLSPIVRGYSLDTRRSMQFFVDRVEDIKFDDNATQSLILDEGSKQLIITMAESQVEYSKSHRGQGRGVVMLLSGGPGTGKTLTAETVAEKLHVPLYKMNAGELGSSPDVVEANLRQLMMLMSQWHAILLLDECEVFLAQRTTQDLVRNQMVSIFLRMLEYNEGTVFLTTNRITDIDPAFLSRIRLIFKYPSLDVGMRWFVWATLLRRAVSFVGDEELNVLSSIDLNGKQIKNIVRTAEIMAMMAGWCITFENVQTVLKSQGYTIPELVRLQDLIESARQCRYS